MSFFKRLFKSLKSEDIEAETGKREALNLLSKLQKSTFFDAEWYLKQNPDVAAAGMDAAFHYLYHGAAEGRRAGARFDDDYYLSQLNGPLVYASPFLHFLAEGEAIGLQPTRVWNDEPWWWQLPQQGSQNVNCAALLNRLNQHNDVIIVIPVFNAAEALERCLDALAIHCYGISQVIIVDDASTDVSIQKLLARYQDNRLYQCVTNTQNLGFSGSVNRGMAIAAEMNSAADIVLLNSDTEVTSGWLRQLRYAAYSFDNVATVTPVSNNAGAFSVPQSGENDIPADYNLGQLSRVFAQGGVMTYPVVPTGHGFCLFVRRAALDRLGYFDADAFPRGYGEENDFCMRALAAGWQNLIAPKAYVYHQRSASFGSDKSALLKQGRDIVDARYLQYTSLVRAAFSSADVIAMRNRAFLLASLPVEQISKIKPRALYVISTRTGGTPQTNQDLMRGVANRLECFLLHCDGQKLTLQHFIDDVYTEVEQYNLSQPIEAITHTNSEYDEVVAHWLLKWSIELVHVRHLAWHSLGLLKVVKTLGLPLVHSFHDFYTLCPTVKLLDEKQQYCAARCTASTGKCKHELWPESAFNTLKHSQVYVWQQLFEHYLQQCDAFVTTNEQAKQLIIEKFPSLNTKTFAVIGHGRDFAHFANLASRPKFNEPIRVLCPGNISFAKGLAIIEALAIHYPEQIEIHILGKVSSEIVLPNNVVVHGSYAREQFLALVSKINPHCGAVLSIWPETWCHTLTELWAAGVPVLGLPFGAVAERINLHGAGWVVAEASAEQVADIFLQQDFVNDWQQKQQAVLNWQEHHGKRQSCQYMAEQYLALYEDLNPSLTTSIGTKAI